MSDFMTVERRNRCRLVHLCTSCGSQLASRGRLTCKWCRERANSNKRAWTPKYRRNERVKVLDRYGGCCKVCGISDHDVLQIDHVHNDGYQDRKNGRDTKAIHRKVAREGFPDRYQVLCANCNWKKKANSGHTPEKVSWGPLTMETERPRISDER